MLDIANSARDGVRLFEGASHPRADAEKPGFTVAQLVDFVRRQWPVVGIAVLVLLCLGTAYLILTPPRYTGIR